MFRLKIILITFMFMYIQTIFGYSMFDKVQDFSGNQKDYLVVSDSANNLLNVIIGNLL